MRSAVGYTIDKNLNRPVHRGGMGNLHKVTRRNTLIALLQKLFMVHVLTFCTNILMIHLPGEGGGGGGGGIAPYFKYLYVMPPTLNICM